jgi:hypothetical protein
VQHMSASSAMCTGETGSAQKLEIGIVLLSCRGGRILYHEKGCAYKATKATETNEFPVSGNICEGWENAVGLCQEILLAQ